MISKNKAIKKAKKNQKAFTIIEMLGVIALLLVLASIIFPLVTKYMETGKIRYDVALEKELLVSGKNYYASAGNKKYLPQKQGTMGYVTAVELGTKNLLSKELVNSKGEDCSESYVVVENQENYKYTACLECNGVPYNPETGGNTAKPECAINLAEPDLTYYILYNKSKNENETSEVVGDEIGFTKAKYGEQTQLKTNTWTRQGYNFVGWETSNGTLVSSNALKIEESNKDQYIEAGVTPDQVILYARWEKKPEPKKPECDITTTQGSNNSVTVKIYCKDTNNCQGQPYTEIVTNSKWVSHTIYSNEGTSTSCSKYIYVDPGTTNPDPDPNPEPDPDPEPEPEPTPPEDKDTTPPIAKIDRESCTKKFIITAKDNTGGSGLASYAWSQSSSTPGSWKTYTGTIPQPTYQSGVTIYLHLKDKAGNTTVSNGKSMYTSCGTCAKETRTPTVYWWGNEESSHCLASKPYKVFYFRWYDCNCKSDKLTDETCSVSASEGSHGHLATIYYKSGDACRSTYLNGGVTEVCESYTRYGMRNKSAGDRITYHGYYFYYNTTPIAKNFQVGGYWYHDGENKNQGIYDGRASSYITACKKACATQ